MGILSAIRKRSFPEAGPRRAAGRNGFDELSRAAALLSTGIGFAELESVLVEQSCDITGSDLAALYLYAGDSRDQKSLLRLSYKRGPWPVPSALPRSGDTVAFLEDCGEAAVLNRRRPCALEGLLLHSDMASGMALPIAVPKSGVGILFVNARTADHYDRVRMNFLGSFCALAAGMLRSAQLFQELKAHAAAIEALERYQESVFSSMTNLLVTTERDGSVRYYNEEAARAFDLTESDIGKPLPDILGPRVNAKILKSIETTLAKGATLLGVEGIAAGSAGDLDFSLNLSPIRGKRSDRPDGLTLLFTDQSRERALKERVNVVVEERRVIKDMFSRYLSAEVVQSLMEFPDQVRLGGAGKKATVFFADIRGYTSFSEGRTPEYILEVLNDYFSQAVEMVLKYRGFIDKFIGDCIMAAWGVPMTSETGGRGQCGVLRPGDPETHRGPEADLLPRGRGASSGRHRYAYGIPRGRKPGIIPAYELLRDRGYRKHCGSARRGSQGGRGDPHRGYPGAAGGCIPAGAPGSGQGEGKVGTHPYLQGRKTPLNSGGAPWNVSSDSSPG